ncbi:MAG TPA: protein translocase subunit SecF [Thermoanaerobaculia bacterium]|nr:protein translocase subunit SecF [Thermoanaerobaculia bacterium]
MEILRDTNFDFLKYRKFWILFSLALILAGIFFVFVHGNLNVGVDFAGGTQINLQFRERPDIERLRGVLEGAGLEEVQIQRFGQEDENEVMVRTRLVEGQEQGSLEKVVTALNSDLNPGQAGKPDVNQIGADALAAFLTQADPDKLGPAGAARYLQTADEILEQRRDKGLFNSWDELAGLGGLSQAGLQALQQRATLGNFTVVGVESVGPQIGEELRRQGFYAVILSLIGMLIYIWVRFELRFGVGAIVGCIHDVLVTLFLFAAFDYEFNLTTVAAFLTLIGYSVNDTVVIFDRIRENMRKTRRKPLIEIMNESINQTLSRTILTGGSTLLALGALLVLGSDVIKGFAFVMLVGVIVGTYSSIYVASSFALLWEDYFGAGAKARRAGHATETPAHTKAG